MSHRLNPSLNRIPRNLAAPIFWRVWLAHRVPPSRNCKLSYPAFIDRYISIPGKYRSVHLYFAGQLPLPLRNQSPRINGHYTEFASWSSGSSGGGEGGGGGEERFRIHVPACFAHIDHQKLLPLCLSRCRGDNMNPERSHSRWPSITTAPFLQTYECRFEARFREGKEVEEVVAQPRSLTRWKNQLNFRELLILFIAEVTFKNFFESIGLNEISFWKGIFAVLNFYRSIGCRQS